MLLQDTHGLVDIIQRHFGMSVGKPVLEHSVHDALVGVPFGIGVTLGLVPDIDVSAAGAD